MRPSKFATRQLPHWCTLKPPFDTMEAMNVRLVTFSGKRSCYLGYIYIIYIHTIHNIDYIYNEYTCHAYMISLIKFIGASPARLTACFVPRRNRTGEEMRAKIQVGGTPQPNHEPPESCKQPIGSRWIQYHPVSRCG